MFKLSASCHSPVAKEDVPCISLLTSSCWPSSGSQNPSCCDPSSSRLGVTVVRDRATFGLTDDHILNCHHLALACVGYTHQVFDVSFSVTNKLPFQCPGFKFADVSVPLPHGDCAIKNKRFTNWKLRFYASHQHCWALFFSSSHNSVSHSYCEESLLPTSSWEVLSHWASILLSPVSSCNSQVSHSPFCGWHLWYYPLL